MAAGTDRIEEFLKPIVEAQGCEIVDLQFGSSRSGGKSLTLYIYKQGGVGVDDCESVHRAIDGPLDEFDPTGGQPYTLNVSSPGLDRAFTRDSDFARNMGKQIEIKLYAPLGGKKVYTGKLVGFDGESVTVESEGGQTVFERAKAAKISLKLDF